jgi:hypothetical protein
MNAWKKLLTCGAVGLFFLWGVVASLGWYGERQRRLEECQRLQGIVNQLRRYAQRGFAQNAQEARARWEKSTRKQAGRSGANPRITPRPQQGRNGRAEEGD